MVIGLLRIFSILCVAFTCGKLITKLKLPAILGWLIVGIVFGPYLAGVVTSDIINSVWYKIIIKIFECFAGVMIGREIIFKKIVKSGKQIIGITFVQSIGTFLFVSAAFSVVFIITHIPVFLAFVFGGIALATAPAPALSIVNEYHTSGPVTKTLLPLAAIDDVIGVVVFFTVVSIVSGTHGGIGASPLTVIGMVLLPFVNWNCFRLFDRNFVKSRQKKQYSFLSLVIVIVNLGMPLDYRLIAGAGIFTVIYILSRAIGKIGGAYIGGKLTKAQPVVTKYLGFTLLPHSGVSLVFTGIATTTLSSFEPSLATIVSGTIVAAAIINEIIAVVVAKYAFKWAGEIEEQ